ncbi:hypothetical protein PYCCODRAFT_1468672 [Trametes coccinea BRFM310]|uniref:Uncharacterized protein n=1 Tax=Trametes coccinea (strain BRFM310) TaxID=1353009 RepID=A0A1Y2IK35_TRAC3|nr:hypothetical protein PYCCODRAFT_1468672 [Trametes coccinea BRFM310]
MLWYTWPGFVLRARQRMIRREVEQPEIFSPETVSYSGDPQINTPLQFHQLTTQFTMGSIIVINNSSSTISVFVSKYSNDDGSDAWFTLEPGGRDSWSRTAKWWEFVAFKNANDTNRAGVYVPVDSTVTFTDMAHISVV